MRKSPGKIPRSSQSSDLSRDRRTPATHSPRLRSVPDSLPPSCFLILPILFSKTSTKDQLHRSQTSPIHFEVPPPSRTVSHRQKKTYGHCTFRLLGASQIGRINQSTTTTSSGRRIQASSICTAA
ncbi:hypothetical protein CGCSCA1_v011379 [Colletotrichum siamense]|nr:hypothetical protein CGCSCA1_v011379 [Colletotrichum siamense]